MFPFEEEEEQQYEPIDENINIRNPDKRINDVEQHIQIEPIQTRSQTRIQQARENNEEEVIIECDSQRNIISEEIVGENSRKKVVRNPYGCKGKPKEQVELNFTEIREPQGIEEALVSPQSNEWKQAIEEELDNLERLKTWETVEISKDKEFVDSKWVFKIKRDENGEIAKYKARLVARGFKQRKGTDYTQTYAPVASFSIVRLLLAMTAIFGWTTRHVDIKSAYLNGELAEEIYMRVQIPHETTKKVVKLLRPIYGLKQSGHNWNEALNNFLIESGCTRLESSCCTYRYDFCTFTVIYVDDIAILSRYKETVDIIVHIIQNKYEARDLGEITYFLGVHIVRNPEGDIMLSQEAYIRELLKKYGLQECRTTYTTLESGNQISSDDSPKTDDERRNMRDIPYRELIGSLGYISRCTRPDISFAISKLAQFSSNPGMKHWTEAKRTLKYLGSTITYRLHYTNKEPKIELWSDADWAGDLDDRHSFTGNLTTVGGNIVNWRTSKQRCIATSTMEAEYIAMSNITKEATWLKMFIQELELETWITTPYRLFSDNRAAIDFGKNRIERDKTRHIDIAYHNVRENIDKNLIVLNYVPSKSNISDILTKPANR